MQAYANRTFTGVVKQVRLQSTTLNNVVNYTVVIEVANTDGKLMPGMTATVAFQTGEAKDAVLVPNAALRYKGTEAMIAEAAAKRAAVGDSSKTQSVNTGDAGRAGSSGGVGGRSGVGGFAGTRTGTRPASTSGTIWYVGADGKPALARVHTGLTDGQQTVVMSRDITEGTKLIVGSTVASPATGASAANTNPLQPQTQRGGRGPGGF